MLTDEKPASTLQRPTKGITRPRIGRAIKSCKGHCENYSEQPNAYASNGLHGPRSIVKFRVVSIFVINDVLCNSDIGEEFEAGPQGVND